MAFPLIALSGLLSSPAAKKVGKFIGTNARALLARARRQPAAGGPVLAGFSTAGPMTQSLPLESLVTNVNQSKTRGGYVGQTVQQETKTRLGYVSDVDGTVRTGPNAPNSPGAVYMDDTKTTEKGVQDKTILYVVAGLAVLMLLRK
jgi:hypothetical protein